MSAAVVPQSGVVRPEAGQQGLEGLAGHGVTFERRIEFPNVPGVVPFVVDFHRLPVDGGLEGVMRVAEFREGEAGGGRILCGGVPGSTGALPQPMSPETRGRRQGRLRPFRSV